MKTQLLLGILLLTFCSCDYFKDNTANHFGSFTPSDRSAIINIVESASIHFGDNLPKNAQYVSVHLSNLYGGKWNVYIISSLSNKTDFYFEEYSNRSYCAISSLALNSLQPQWSYQIVKLGASVTTPSQIQGSIDLQSRTVTEKEVKEIKQIIINAQEDCNSAPNKQACIDEFIYDRVCSLWKINFVDKVMTAKSINFVFWMNFHFDAKWVFLHNVGTAKNKTYLIYDTPLPASFCAFAT